MGDLQNLMGSVRVLTSHPLSPPSHFVSTIDWISSQTGPDHLAGTNEPLTDNQGQDKCALYPLQIPFRILNPLQIPFRTLVRRNSSTSRPGYHMQFLRPMMKWAIGRPSMLHSSSQPPVLAMRVGLASGHWDQELLAQQVFGNGVMTTTS